LTGKKQADHLNEADAEAKGDEQLIFVGATIEVANNDAFHQDAENHDEHRACRYGDDEGAGIFERDIAGVTTEHEHRAVGEIEHAERSVDDRQAGADQREQRSERQAVEQLGNEIGPANHENDRGADSQSKIS